MPRFEIYNSYKQEVNKYEGNFCHILFMFLPEWRYVPGDL